MIAENWGFVVGFCSAPLFWWLGSVAGRAVNKRARAALMKIRGEEGTP